MKTALFKHSTLAAITAFVMLGASVQSSSALPLDASLYNSNPTVQHVGWKPNRDEAAALGAVGGFLLGAAVVGAANKKKKKDAMKMHIAFCSGKYQTYNPHTNMYMSTTGPQYCYSPYL